MFFFFFTCIHIFDSIGTLLPNSLTLKLGELGGVWIEVYYTVTSLDGNKMIVGHSNFGPPWDGTSSSILRYISMI